MTQRSEDVERRQRLVTAVLTLEPGERKELLEEVEAALARIGEPFSRSIRPREKEALATRP